MTKKQIGLGTVVAGLVVMTSGAAMAQMTGVSHPDDAIISTSSQAAPVQASSVPVDPYAPLPAQNATQTAGVPVDRYTPTPQRPAAAVVAVSTPVPLSTYQPYTGGPAPADQDSGVVERVPGPSDRLPEGTLMKVRLGQTLSTRTTPLGTEWIAEITEPMMRDGVVMVPAGSTLRGKVTEVHGGKRISGQASIHLTTLSVTLPDGTLRGIHAEVIDTDYNHGVRVGSEGTLLHREPRKEEAGVLALTIGSGAAVGGVVAGVPGALVGAGVGAGVSGILYLKEDKQAELPKGTLITFELTRSMGFGQQ